MREGRSRCEQVEMGRVLGFDAVDERFVAANKRFVAALTPPSPMDNQGPHRVPDGRGGLRFGLRGEGREDGLPLRDVRDRGVRRILPVQGCVLESLEFRVSNLPPVLVGGEEGHGSVSLGAVFDDG